MYVRLVIAAGLVATVVSAAAQEVPGTESYKILHGTEAEPGEFPWQVGLFRDGRFICGGSVIAPRWVLTAAHCVVDLKTGQGIDSGRFQVFGGSNELGKGGRKVGVARIASHESFDWRGVSGMRDDIALLKLSDELSFQPASLPDPDDRPLTEASTPVTVSGWGRTSQGGNISEKLLKATIPLVAHSSCNNAYEGKITANQLCAGESMTEDNKDSCQGDSGGPLVARDGSGKAIQVGLVSWGKGCGHKDYPGVYTRVAAYQPWLRCQTDEGSACGPLSQPADALKLEMLPTAKARLGEAVRFAVTAGWDGYLFVLDINPEGKVGAIFPNKFTRSGGEERQFRSAIQVALPDPERPQFVVRARPPAGRGVVLGLLLTSPDQLEAIAGKSADSRSTNSGDGSRIGRLSAGLTQSIRTVAQRARLSVEPAEGPEGMLAAALADWVTALDQTGKRWSLAKLSYEVTP